VNVHQECVGIFDSGVGGLSVLAAIRRQLPDVPLCYVADGRFCPYGARGETEIRDRSLAIGEALVQRGASRLVVACNTASAAALEALRARWPIPVVGLEPAVKPAVAATKAGRIGVLATPRTATSVRLARLIDRYAGGVEVRVVAAPHLVTLVERGDLEGPTVEAELRAVLQPLLNWGADVLVLGCTHFPFLRPEIARVVGPDVRLLDSGDAVARRTRELIGRREAEVTSFGTLHLMTSGDPHRAEVVSSRLLGFPVAVDSLAI
jgi:glutamate racemase